MGKGARGVGGLLVVALLAVGAAVAWLAAGEDDERASGGLLAPVARPALEAGARELPLVDVGGSKDAAPESLDLSAATAAVGDASAPGAEAAAPGTPFLLTGRAVDLDGRPVAGATVRLLPSGRQLKALGLPSGRGFEPPLDPARFAATTAGADGRFELSARDMPPVELSVVEKPGTTRDFSGFWPVLLLSHAAFESTPRTCRGWSGGPFEAGDIVLRPGSSVVGRVLDEDGHALEDVRVAPPPLFNRTDRSEPFDAVRPLLVAASGPDGRFRLDGLWAGQMSLAFDAPGLASQVRKLDLPGGTVEDLGDVVLERGGTLEGFVSDAVTGAPVAGARVLVRPPLDLFRGSDAVTQAFKSKVATNDVMVDRETLADEAGAFRITGLDPQSPKLDVFAGAAGYEPVKMGEVERGGGPLVLSLPRAASIVLTVVDPDSGEPVPDAKVEARRHADDGEWSWSALEVLSEPAKLAELGVPGPHAGVHLLSHAGSHRNTAIVSAPGRAKRGFLLPTAVAPERVTATIQLPRAVGFAGRVLDEEQKPLAGATLTLHAPDDLRVKLPDVEERSGEDGRFRFAGLLHGDWDLTAAAPGFVTSTPRTLKLRLGQALPEEEIVLLRGGVLAGVVTVAVGPPPITEVHARSLAALEALRAAEAAAGGALPMKDRPVVLLYKALTDAEGRFRIESLAPGAYELSGPPGVQLTAEVRSGKTTEVTLAARARPRVRGRVLDAQGPVAGATISADMAYGGPGGWVSEGAEATSGPDGTFEMELWGPSKLRVFAREADATTSMVDVEVTWDSVVWVDLRFGGGVLRGVVVSAATGDALPGAKLRLMGKKFDAKPGAPLINTSQRRTSDEQGRFEFTRLATGPYAVTVESAGHARLTSERVEIVDGAPPEELRVALQPGGALHGVVRPAPGGAVPDEYQIRLEFLDAPLEKLRATLDDDGAFTRDGLLPGRWRCDVTDNRLASDAPAVASTEVRVLAGEMAEVEITVPD